MECPRPESTTMQVPSSDNHSRRALAPRRRRARVPYWGWIALLGLSSAPTSAGQEGSRKSLEELLQSVRAQRESVQQQLLQEVIELVGEFESVAVRTRPQEVSQRVKKLKGLGPEVPPLLVQFLDPGSTPTKGERFRSSVIVDMLRDSPSNATTRDLLKRLTSGSLEGRRNVLRVLAVHPNPERVREAILDLFGSASGDLKLEALLALARLGTEDFGELLQKTLQDSEAEFAGKVVRSLGTVPGEVVGAAVLSFLKTPDAGKQLPDLAAFYLGRPDLLKERDHLERLVELTATPELDSLAVVAVLQMLVANDTQLKGNLKKSVSNLVASGDSEIRTSALILLARSKDKSARRELIKGYNERIENRRSYPEEYVSRGDVYYQIAEYQSAIKDYKEAIRLQNGRPRSVSRADPFLGIARCYARLKRYNDAEEYLTTAPVSMSTLRGLAQEPAFAEMLKTKYRRAFHLRD